jgi:hypothetical protein
VRGARRRTGAQVEVGEDGIDGVWRGDAGQHDAATAAAGAAQHFDEVGAPHTIGPVEAARTAPMVWGAARRATASARPGCGSRSTSPEVGEWAGASAGPAFVDVAADIRRAAVRHYGRRR